MAHDIATINDRAAMAYVNETPWHGLGTRVTGLRSVAEALTTAHLDWEVHKEPVYVEARKWDSKLGRLGARVTGRVALVRYEDDGMIVLGNVSDNYEVIQNSEAFSVLQPAMERFGVTIETAGALSNGRRVWMLAKLPTGIEPIAGDRIDGYFLVTTGHTGWLPYIAKPTPIRVVCANTLAMAVGGQATVRLRHTKGAADQMDVVAAMIRDIVHALKLTNESFAKLAAKKMTLDQTRKYVNEVLRIYGEPSPVEAKKAATIVDLSLRGKGVDYAPETAWTAFNAVTEYVDHVRASAKSPKTLVAMNKSAVFGPNAKLKDRALTLALKFAA